MGTLWQTVRHFVFFAKGKETTFKDGYLSHTVQIFCNKSFCSLLMTGFHPKLFWQFSQSETHAVQDVGVRSRRSCYILQAQTRKEESDRVRETTMCGVNQRPIAGGSDAPITCE